MHHPWWPHLFSWPRIFDPVSWWWLSFKGYALTSSWFQVSFIWGSIILLRHRNCHRKRCWRLGHNHPEHGWPSCKRHWHETPDHVVAG